MFTKSVAHKAAKALQDYGRLTRGVSHSEAAAMVAKFREAHPDIAELWIQPPPRPVQASVGRIEGYEEGAATERRRGQLAFDNYGTLDGASVESVIGFAHAMAYKVRMHEPKLKDAFDQIDELRKDVEKRRLKNRVVAFLNKRLPLSYLFMWLAALTIVVIGAIQGQHH